MATGLRDRALDARTQRYWVERGLPVIRLTQDQNSVRIPVEYAARFSADERVVRKLESI
jgi:hypothetical protein